MFYVCYWDARRLWVLNCSRCTIVPGASACSSGWHCKFCSCEGDKAVDEPLHA